MPNVEEKITFGIELEGVVPSPRAREISERFGFIQRFDHSVKYDDGSQMPSTLEDGGGFEFITPPACVDLRMSNVGERLTFCNDVILPNDRVPVSTIDEIVLNLCNCIQHSNSSCGVHIHLGKPSREGTFISRWEPEKVRAMLAIGMMIEDKIFRVVPDSRVGNMHCRPLRDRYTDEDLGQFYPVGVVRSRKYDNEKRYCWMNLIETRRVGDDPRPGRGNSTALGTIEIRALGQTHSVEYIVAWLKLWLKISAYVAHLPTSLAVLRCGLSNEFENDLAVLAKLKSEVVVMTTPMEATTVLRADQLRRRRPIFEPPSVPLRDLVPAQAPAQAIVPAQAPAQAPRRRSPRSPEILVSITRTNINPTE